MKVRRLPKDPGPAAWNCLLPAALAATPLMADTTADSCVIGAGFAGLAAAARLCQDIDPASVVILDAARVGEGPAGRNSGFMIDLPHDLSSSNYGGRLAQDIDTAADNRRAIAFAGELATRFNLPTEAFDPSGKVNAAATDKGHQHNLDYARHLADMDEPHELLSAADMAAMTGTDYYQSGLRTPGAVMLQPAMFVRGVAVGLQGMGVRLHENSPVIGLTQGNDGWRLDTPSGSVAAQRVILAVNGHLESFGYQRGRLMHMHTYASMTRALNDDEIERLGGVARWGVTPADPLGTTVRRISGTGGDRIIIRNRFTFDPSMQVTDARLRDVARDHDRAFAARFPMLAGVETEYLWGGRLCLSLNNVQVIDEIAPGLFSGCCQNGLGTARGTLAGLLAAELALGQASPSLDRARAAAPPRPLPPGPIARLGATARLRWGERRAGCEL